MRLTAFSDVSLRVLLLLASLDGEKLSTQRIAEGVGTPYNHVAKSVAFLANLGLLDATRGRSGGVTLSEAGKKATIGQVLRLSEGDTPIVECESANSTCPMIGNCKLRGVLGRARESFFSMLDDVVISDLASPETVSGPVFVALGLGPLGRVQKPGAAS